MTAAVAVALAVLVVPGFLIGLASGLRLSWALVAAVPITFSLFGLVGWLFGMISVPFTVLSASLALVVFCLLGLGWRVAYMKLTGRRVAFYSLDDVRVILPGLGVLAGIVILVAMQLGLLEQMPRGAENIVQGWDVHWHASVVRLIMDEGMASATRMGELQNVETANHVYYPVAYHAAAAITGDIAGLSPIVANNVMSIVAPSVALPLSMAMFAWKMVGNRGLIAQAAAAFAGIVACVSPTLIWVGLYVGAWPYLAAVAVSGIVFGMFCSLAFQPVMLLATALAFTGITQLHPSAVTIVVIFVGLWWLNSLLFKPARGRWRDLGVIAGSAVLGIVLMLPQLLAGSSQAEEVTSWDATEKLTRAESWAKAAGMSTRHVEQFFGYEDLTVVLILAGFGAVALLLWRGNLWAPLAYFFSLVLCVHALSPLEIPGKNILSLIAGLHYATAHRLVMPVAMLTFAAAAVGVAIALRLLLLGPVAYLIAPDRIQLRRRWQQATGALFVAVGVLVAGGLGWWSQAVTNQGANNAYLGFRGAGPMVSTADIKAWDWLAKQPYAYDGLIAGEAADGSGWMYAYNGLPSLFRHYLWPSNGRVSATGISYWNANLLGQGSLGDTTAANITDRAMDALDVYYIMLSPPNFWAQQLPRWEQLHGLWTAAGATPVYRDGNVVIFAVDKHFSTEQLQTMQRQSPDPLTADAVGVAE